MIGLGVGLIGGLLWIGLRGSADLGTFVVGASVSVAAAWVTRVPLGGGVGPIRLARASSICARLLSRFALDLARANLRQLRLILSPTVRVRPRWIRFSTRLEHPASREALGVMISLTPGTVTEEIAASEFTIHVLDAAPEEDPVAEIRDRFESLLMRLEAV